jgi:intein-encoded DNA endonuclease-like protein
MKSISSVNKAYLAGFLDGDGSIYVRLKPNSTYRYGFQVAPYVVFFQSQKSRKLFEQVCALIGTGYMRERKDGILEYTIGRTETIRDFLKEIAPFAIMKKDQIALMLKILGTRGKVETSDDFEKLMKLIERFRELNYSKKRIKRTLTPKRLHVGPPK